MKAEIRAEKDRISSPFTSNGINDQHSDIPQSRASPSFTISQKAAEIEKRELIISRIYLFIMNK